MTKRARLDTSAARAKLSPRGKPYWTEAGAKVDLGYRRLNAGVGSWVMRRYIEETRTYAGATFAHADDDKEEANGVDILNYHQAQIGREWRRRPSKRSGSQLSGRRSTLRARSKTTSQSASSAMIGSASPDRSTTLGTG